ncbi:MAG: hypothetical protein WHS88_08915, partial [Anaerohalosphaeraceae bacterium]
FWPALVLPAQATVIPAKAGIQSFPRPALRSFTEKRKRAASNSPARKGGEKEKRSAIPFPPGWRPGLFRVQELAADFRPGLFFSTRFRAN